MNVLFPENDAQKMVKTAPTAQTAAQTTASRRDLKSADGIKPRGGGDFSKAKSKAPPLIKDPHVTAATKGDIDGLYFERALPGDKRLG